MELISMHGIRIMQRRMELASLTCCVGPVFLHVLPNTRQALITPQCILLISHILTALLRPRSSSLNLPRPSPLQGVSLTAS